MKMFNVPLQLEREEKIFGGSFSLRQVIFVIAGVGIGAMFFTAYFKRDLFVSLLLWGIFSFTGIFLAFFKKEEIEIDRYIVMYIRFMLSPREYPFRGGGR